VRALDRLEAVDTGLFSPDRYLPNAAADADIRLTFAAAAFARDLRGRVKPGEVGEEWFGPKRKLSLGKLVYQAANAADVEGSLRRAAPAHPQYARMREALARLRKVAASGGWPSVPEGAVVKASARDPDLSPFRARLAAGGYYTAANSPANDRAAEAAALREAVKRFQREHALQDDGVPGKGTVAAMNVPVEERIRQLEINLERMRWLPDDLGETHILVNVPTFHLEAVRDGRRELAMRVVTGRRDTPTPIFSDTMETVVFSPYWNVPSSILRGEVVPALMKDPAYLERQNMEVLRDGRPVDPYALMSGDASLRVRQRPGAGNALGHVKFLFPNPHDVYLHDTPADALFAREGRSFSHGCVRVERPSELAQWVLAGDAEWTPAKIEAAMHSGQERHVALEQQIPVHIVYFTVWVDDDGTARFADDVYRHDERHAAVVPAAWPPMPRGIEPVAAAN
ncbi:MAG TPA: L,D-transpeptidase family protein, partial [Xanthomonadales bacterium]|nr:L,D-transpeptidase family protein [Xanthomonadales bacterium]